MAWDPPVQDFQATGVAILASNLNKMGNSLLFLEQVAYVEFVSNVTVSATSAATSTEVVSAGAITYEAVPHLIEFRAHRAGLPATSGATIICNLFDGSTDLGRIYEGSNNATTVLSLPIRGERMLTPTAASHTYRITCWRANANGTIFAGAGGTDTPLPGFIRITRIPT